MSDQTQTTPDPALQAFAFDDELLLRNAVRCAKTRRKAPRWVAVMDVFVTGSTTAHALCARFGLDADEVVNAR